MNSNKLICNNCGNDKHFHRDAKHRHYVSNSSQQDDGSTESMFVEFIDTICCSECGKYNIDELPTTDNA